MNTFKKLTIVVLSVLVVFIIALCTTNNWRTRWSLKHECNIGMDCECFSNVIDNRLSDAQVRAFHEFARARKRRPTANILEFIDEASARGISEAITLCIPAPIEQPQQQNQPKNKR